MEKPLKERLKGKMKERGIKIPALSTQTGIPKDRIYAWYRDDSVPKAEDQVILEKWLSGDFFNNNEENRNRGTSENQKVDEITIQASLKALTDMARCNSDLAQAALTRAQADLQREEKEKLLVQSNNRLTELLKPTENIHEVNPLNHPSILSALLQTLAELGIGKYWGSKEEGLVELGNRFALPDDAVEKFENKQAGAGRKSTA